LLEGKTGGNHGHQYHDAAHLAALGRIWIAAWNSRDLERVLAL